MKIMSLGLGPVKFYFEINKFTFTSDKILRVTLT